MGLIMHVVLFVRQRCRCIIGCCLLAGIRLVCVIGAKSVVTMIAAFTGTFVVVVVSNDMAGACDSAFVFAFGLALARALALALVSRMLKCPVLSTDLPLLSTALPLLFTALPLLSTALPLLPTAPRLLAYRFGLRTERKPGRCMSQIPFLEETS